MRIGVLGPQYPDSFADNIAVALEDMGVQMVRLGSIQRPAWGGRWTRAVHNAALGSPALSLHMQEWVVKKVRECEVDTVISVEANLAPSIIEQLRQVRIRTALWYPDHVANLGRQWMFQAPYDAVFLKEPWLVERSTSLFSRSVHYVPEACNPRWHRRPEATSKSPYIVVAGNIYPFRAQVVKTLLSAGIPLKIYGPPISRWLQDSALSSAYTGIYLARHEKAEIFRNAAAVLNTMHPAELEGVNCRLFESAGCGATILTEVRPALWWHFTAEDVVPFTTSGELIERAQALVSAPDSGLPAGDRASTRAHDQHTYQHRLTKILEVIG